MQSDGDRLGAFAKAMSSGFDPLMNFTPPPPPVDRIERTMNPLALSILVVCLAGAILAVWLSPNAVGAMIITWMIVIGAVFLAQKLLPPKIAIDVTLALAIIGLGILIIASPATIPGLMPSM